MPEPSTPTLSAEAQHVIDSLEAHLGAVIQHAKSAAPGAVAEIAGFANVVLDKLESWGVGLRGELESFRARVAALAPPGSASIPAAPAA
jgi:hypothetical protein